MQLKDLIYHLAVLDVDGPLDREITGLTYDARRVAPGMVYFALQGQGVDGHLEIENAVARGAVAVVCRRNGSIRQGATKIEVADTRVALAAAANAFHDGPSEKLKVVLVSGGIGQAEAAILLKQLLNRSGIKTALLGSARHEIGERVLPANRQTLESLEIHAHLREAVQTGCKVCILEAPFEAGALERFKGVALDSVVLTRFGTEPNSADRGAWVSLLKQARFSSKPLCGVGDGDCKTGKELLSGTGVDVQVWYGFSEGMELRGSDLHLCDVGSIFTLHLPQTRFRCKVPLVGRSSIRHLLGAIGAAVYLDVEPGAMQRSIEALQPAPGSLEKIATGYPFSVFVDQARSPEELGEVLQSLREICGGRILLALGCEHGVPGRIRFEIGKIAGALADRVILTSDNPGREPVEQICSAIAQGLEQGRAAYHFQPEREKAIGELIQLARPADLVLITGKGQRTFQELAHTILPFDDREFARQHLERLPLTQPMHRRGSYVLAEQH